MSQRLIKLPLPVQRLLTTRVEVHGTAQCYICASSVLTFKKKSFCKAMYDINQWKNVVSIIFTVYLQQINTISCFHIKPNWHVDSSFKTFYSLVSLERKKKTCNHNKEPLPNYRESSCHVLHQFGDVRECSPPQPCWKLNRYCGNGWNDGFVTASSGQKLKLLICT